MSEKLPFRGGEARCEPAPLGVSKLWLYCIVHLDDARDVARRYCAPAEWGKPIAASAWANDDDDGRIRMFCADFANGRRQIVRIAKSGRWKMTTQRTPERALAA